MKYQDRLQELGLDEKKLPSSIKKSVVSLNEILFTHEDANRHLREATEQDDIDATSSDISQMEEDIEQLDDRIVEKIEDWHSNKAKYDAIAQKMKEGKLAKQGVVVEKQVAPTTQVSQPQVASKVVEPQQNAQIPYVEATVVPEKKKSNWALWLVAGIIAVITVNQVMIKVDD